MHICFSTLRFHPSQGVLKTNIQRREFKKDGNIPTKIINYYLGEQFIRLYHESSESS